PRVLGCRRRGRAEPALAEELLRGDAPVRLAVRVSELHRPGPAEVGSRVLRNESRSSDRGQAQVRPAKRLQVQAEHPGQAGLSGSCAVTSVPLPGGLITKSVPPTASARSRRPRIPVPLAGSAPPRPSSVISKRRTSSSSWIVTVARVASACLATLVSASR